MIIGVPKEIKKNENRVGLTPESVEQLVKDGHEVFVETNAGIGIGMSDADYEKAGAKILNSLEEVFEKSTMIVKVKEPQQREIKCLKPHHLLYTYLHLAADYDQAKGLMESGATCIAYETVELDHKLPLLIPMSEVAGRISVQVGAYFLQKNNGGKGLLLGGVPGTRRGNVVILGAGITGTHAMEMAIGLGANVTILDINVEKLRHLDEIYKNKITTLYSSQTNIEKIIPEADLVIGSVLIPGLKAPKLIRKEHLKLMQKGTVLVDIAIDQGGCFETSKPTTHENPIYEIDGIIHYSVANMPGAVPRTSTYALNNATLKYARILANNTLEDSISKYPELKLGINIYKGKLVHEGIAKDLNLEYTPLNI